VGSREESGGVWDSETYAEIYTPASSACNCSISHEPLVED